MHDNKVILMCCLLFKGDREHRRVMTLSTAVTVPRVPRRTLSPGVIIALYVLRTVWKREQVRPSDLVFLCILLCVLHIILLYIHRDNKHCRRGVVG